MSELNVSVEELSPVVRRLRIEVPPDRVVSVTDTVYLRLGRTVKLPGYRAGHIPRRVLEKHFSDEVKSEVAREVMKKTFPEALSSVNLAPVSEPTIEPETLTLGETFRYAARIEIRPDVQLQQYKGLEVVVKEVSVSDADVDARLNDLRESHAELIPVEGRTVVQMGDHASINYELTFEGTSRPPEKKEGGLIEIRAGTFLHGSGEQLAGMQVGETRTLTEVLTDEAGPKLAGKTARIQVTVTGLKTRSLPDLDDEFAKDVKGLDTLDALKASIRTELEERAKKEQDAEKRQAAIDALIEKNPVEAPPALVEASAHQIASEYAYNLARYGLKLDQHPQFLEGLTKEALPRATREVKGVFLLDAVAKAENITVKAEDLDQKLASMAAEERQPVAKIAARYSKPDALNGLASRIRNERAVDLVLASAQVTFRAPEPEPAPESVQESGAAT